MGDETTMGRNSEGTPNYGLIGLVTRGVEELLEQVEYTVDHYKSVFFSSDKPTEPALELGNLAAEMNILGGIAMSLHSLQQAVEGYETALNEITGAKPDAKVSPQGLFLVPWPKVPRSDGQTPLPLDDLDF